MWVESGIDKIFGEKSNECQHSGENWVSNRKTENVVTLQPNPISIEYKH